MPLLEHTRRCTPPLHGLVPREGFGSFTGMGGVVAARSSTLVRAVRARLGSPPPNSKKAGTTAGLNFTGRGRILSSSCAILPMRTPASGAGKDHGISRNDLPCPTGTVTGEQAWRLGALEP